MSEEVKKEDDKTVGDKETDSKTKVQLGAESLYPDRYDAKTRRRKGEI